ncbi:type VII secretion target [Millisia brevis]|uniref:type VII secretion target n=1 Tax=Millisia brevis TaxID=264148 RepID=UPI0008334801|nr:type VII secretion target [Millisia brevis]
MPDGETLRIEPGAAERIARAFDTHAKNLAQVADRLRNAGYSTGFAGFPSAMELDEGFKNKADLAIAHLQSQAKVSREYAAKLRAAGAAYTETDTTNSTTIHAAGDEVTPESGPR